MVPDRAVGIIYKDGKVLLMHRAKHGKEYYILPGGGVDEGETPEEAIVREIMEETGLVVEQPVEPVFVRKATEYSISPKERDGYYFLFTEFSGEPELGGPEKEKMHEGNQYHLHWKTLDELSNIEVIYPEGIKETVLKYLRDLE